VLTLNTVQTGSVLWFLVVNRLDFRFSHEISPKFFQLNQGLRDMNDFLIS